MHRLTIPLVFVFAMLAALAGTATAADAAAPSGGSVFDLLDPVREAFAGGRYAYAGALALVVGVTLLKRFGGDRWPALRGDVGGTAVTMIGAFAASLAASLAPGGTLTIGMLWTATSIGVGAAGAYNVAKKLLVVPILAPLAARYPKLGTLLRPLLFVFDGPAKADAVGQPPLVPPADPAT